MQVAADSPQGNPSDYSVYLLHSQVQLEEYDAK